MEESDLNEVTSNNCVLNLKMSSFEESASLSERQQF